MAAGLLAFDKPPPPPGLGFQRKEMAVNAVKKAIGFAPIFYISSTIISFSDFYFLLLLSILTGSLEGFNPFVTEASVHILTPILTHLDLYQCSSSLITSESYFLGVSGRSDHIQLKSDKCMIRNPVVNGRDLYPINKINTYWC